MTTDRVPGSIAPPSPLSIPGPDGVFVREQIEATLGQLTSTERRVMQLRLGLEDGRARTLEAVGRELGVTRERIRQIEAKALRNLRHASRSRKLMDHGEDPSGIDAPGRKRGCGSSLTGMTGITNCELQIGHAGAHQGRLWGIPSNELDTWKIGGSWGCTPPFFTPNPDEWEEEFAGLLTRLENGSMVRLEGPIPEGAYRCRRVCCWQLQSLSGTAACPTCSAPICARCFRCGGLWVHMPSGELAYRSDRQSVSKRGIGLDTLVSPSRGFDDRSHES